MRPEHRYERDALLQAVIDRSGFTDLLEAEGAQKEKQKLAILPSSLSHFNLELYHERPVHTAILEALLLRNSDRNFSSCVLIYGMGGTGKVSRGSSADSALYLIHCAADENPTARR